MTIKRVSITSVSSAIGLLLTYFLMGIFSFWSVRVKASPTLINTPIMISANPTVSSVNPNSAPKDLDTSIIITGTGFTAELSGTAVITPPTVQLGSFTLPEVSWISSTQLTATVPWSLNPAVYTLTVINPGNDAGLLSNAFTVTQGIGVWTTDGPYGGGIDRVVIHPITQTTIFANAPLVGLFRSRDSGENWEQVTGILGPGHFNTNGIAINASGDTILAGGDNGWYRNPSGDGNDTWFHMQWLDGWLTNPVAHPISDTVFYAADRCGLPHKSIDGGWSWLDWSVGITDTTCAGGAQLAFDPIEPLTMYLGLSNGNIFLSNDGGENWNFASRPVSALWAMVVNPFGNHEVWVSTDNRWGDHSTGVLKSTNSELTAWIDVEEEPGKLLLWARYINFPPVTWGESHSGTVYLPFGNNLTKSIDNGASWNITNHDFFIQDLGLYPTDTNRMFVGGEGVHFSQDSGNFWSQMNEGLSAVVPGELAVAQNNPETLYALENGNVYFSDRAGESWKLIDAPTQGNFGIEAVATDPFINSRVYLGGAEGDGKVYVSDDNGLSWPTTGVLARTEQYSACNTLMEVIKTDPITPDRLLTGVGYFCGDWSNPGGGLYLSTDGGHNWANLNVTGLVGQVNDIIYDPQNPARVFAGTWESGLFTSTDSGATWQAVDSLMNNKNIGSLTVEPASPYRIYAAGQYSGSQAVYRSDDGGGTWVQATTPGNGVERRGLVVVPGTSQVLYAATDSGLFWSDDGAQSWQPAVGILGQVPIHSLAVGIDGDRSILYVGTAGGTVSVASYLSATNSEAPVNAGVYRFTSVIMDQKVYLPLIIK